MNVEIGTETPIFLFWEYLFRNFGILSLQCTPCFVHRVDAKPLYLEGAIVPSMDQITIKTPNPKYCLYWCFIEFIDWR
jgi:hypothetical protein